MKNLVFLISFSFFATTLIAENSDPLEKISIFGKVIDNETKLPLEYATIVVKSLEGEIVTGGITDNNGSFDILISRGTYNISVEFISFKTYTFRNKEITKTTDLGVISLEIDAQALDEVEIIAEKSTVEIRLDKKIYNVGKDMTVKGGTASDVLDNVPSVSVDVEGNVSLRGNENVRILVNGKPSGLVGLSGTDALRQLPADAIEKVEVITSPSARYDAEGTAGILNIILRKGKALGFNGTFTLSAGNPDNLGVSTNLNYRTKKVNFFTNLGYSYRNSPGNSFSKVTYFDDFGNTLNYRNEEIEYKRENKGLNTRFGLEYFLTDKSSLTGSVLYRKSNGDDLATNSITELGVTKNLLIASSRLESESEDDKTIEYNLNFTKDFNTSGHKLTLDLQYGKSNEDNFTYITDKDTFPSLIENAPERNITDESDTGFQFKGDYTLPLGETAQFELGFNIVMDKLNSDYLVEEFENNQYINNTNFSNTLEFEQNIYAFYSQYGKKINKFSYLLGLRSETTDRRINLIQTNEVYNKKFTELFPTVNLGLELNDTESFTLGYSRRLRRPRHWFLNPFESRTSETYVRKGNVNLDPTYTNSFDLGYLKRWEKLTFNSSIYFQHAINNIEFIQIDELRLVDNVETLVIVRSPVNLSQQDRYGFEFTANYNPFKWWKLTNSFNFFESITDGEYDNINYDIKNVSWFTRLDSRITLPGGIDWQTKAMYMAPSEGAQSKRKAIISVDLAFSKDILNEKGTLSLRVSDLLNSRKRKSTSYSPTTISEGEFQWRQRQIMLNFTYRLNQKKQRQRQGGNYNGGDEEMFKA
ncbi:outer membrane beta-barrel protein [Lutibacter flavus]|uniref:Outer membrane receptor proteins, mostly Fe transport n=1 Tax=Lutibacter flavus TaxID=691689 RepID=A0A238VGC0_9FLAO|nr:outer membrane beta-barrel protein [Lutibacter flavus]SNR33445.1 Outer membrane receptor proteins, mostly Fe transport [Lutibacter flavus]